MSKLNFTVHSITRTYLISNISYHWLQIIFHWKCRKAPPPHQLGGTGSKAPPPEQCYFQAEHPLRAIWNGDALGGEWHALQGDISTISCRLPSVIVGIGSSQATFTRLENVVELITAQRNPSNRISPWSTIQRVYVEQLQNLHAQLTFNRYFRSGRLARPLLCALWLTVLASSRWRPDETLKRT